MIKFSPPSWRGKEMVPNGAFTPLSVCTSVFLTCLFVYLFVFYCWRKDLSIDSLPSPISMRRMPGGLKWGEAPFPLPVKRNKISPRVIFMDLLFLFVSLVTYFVVTVFCLQLIDFMVINLRMPRFWNASKLLTRFVRGGRKGLRSNRLRLNGLYWINFEQEDN